MNYPVWHHIGFKTLCALFMFNSMNITREVYLQNERKIEALHEINKSLRVMTPPQK